MPPTPPLERIARLVRRSAAPPAVHVGIDIGRARTKMVAVQRDAGTLRVIGAADVQTPARMLSNGRLADLRAATRLLASLARQLGVRGREAGLALPASQAHLRCEEMDRLPRDAMLAAIRSGSSLQRTDVGPGALLADCCEVEADQPTEGTMVVLALVARGDVAQGYRQAVQRSGLRPGAVTATSVALSNALHACAPARARSVRPLLLIHAGHGGALFVLHHAGAPLVTHLVQLGGADAADAYDAAPTPLRPDAPEPAWVERVAQEARRTAGALPRAWARDPKPFQEALLSGGLAADPRVAPALEEALGLPVTAFDPLRCLPAADSVVDSCGPALTLCVGLAAEGLLRIRGAP